MKCRRPPRHRRWSGFFTRQDRTSDAQRTGSRVIPCESAGVLRSGFAASDWTLTKFGDGTAVHENFALGNPIPSLKVTISCSAPGPGARTTVTAVVIKNDAA